MKRKAVLIETGCVSGHVYQIADNLQDSGARQAPAGAKHVAFPNTCADHSLEVCYLQKQAMNKKVSSWFLPSPNLQSTFLFWPKTGFKKMFSPSLPSAGESGASPCHHAPYPDCLKAVQPLFASPVVDIHPCSSLAVSIQTVKHSYICPVYNPSFFSPFFAIPSCSMFTAARHSCFLATQLVFRIVAQTTLPHNTVASHPEGRLMQDSFPLE